MNFERRIISEKIFAFYPMHIWIELNIGRTPTFVFVLDRHDISFLWEANIKRKRK